MADSSYQSSNSNPEARLERLYFQASQKERELANSQAHVGRLQQQLKECKDDDVQQQRRYEELQRQCEGLKHAAHLADSRTAMVQSSLDQEQSTTQQLQAALKKVEVDKNKLFQRFTAQVGHMTSAWSRIFEQIALQSGKAEPPGEDDCERASVAQRLLEAFDEIKNLVQEQGTRQPTQLAPRSPQQNPELVEVRSSSTESQALGQAQEALQAMSAALDEERKQSAQYEAELMKLSQWADQVSDLLQSPCCHCGQSPFPAEDASTSLSAEATMPDAGEASTNY